MSPHRHVTLFHAPNSRSTGVRTLLEELHVEYELHVVNLKSMQQRNPEYLAINPMGKVPALRDGDTLITEQAAIYLYLGELYPKCDISPAVGDEIRGAYLRWMVFYGSCMEPAVIDKSLNRDSGPPRSSPYGSYEIVIDTVQRQLEHGPWLLGKRFTAADILWASALAWMSAFKLIPEMTSLLAYIERFRARPAVKRTLELDAALALSQT